MRWRFAAFEFDSGSRELRGPAGPLHLSPKAVECLAALLERRPEAVPRAQLHDRLWPKTFVAETSLRRVIAEIRAVLGDDEQKPRFIRNVRGFGYAFCGTASEPAPPPQGAERGTACRLEWGKREIPLHEGENLLGRTDDAVAWIDSPTVSRRHARIVVAEGKATIEDLGSKNGTTVSGRKIDGVTTLEGGDQIELGSVLMTYRVFRAGGSTETKRSGR
ncbi:MAG TPA: winged helix-turn-helix domain-containing protein [Vicinamibacteria bacterium]|nr:winged helix-turn-helix domain-containing protein [Vicinamibacteria bacterium]